MGTIWGKAFGKRPLKTSLLNCTRGSIWKFPLPTEWFYSLFCLRVWLSLIFRALWLFFYFESKIGGGKLTPVSFFKSLLTDTLLALIARCTDFSMAFFYGGLSFLISFEFKYTAMRSLGGFVQEEEFDLSMNERLVSTASWLPASITSCPVWLTC